MVRFIITVGPMTKSGVRRATGGVAGGIRLEEECWPGTVYIVLEPTLRRSLTHGPPVRPPAPMFTPRPDPHGCHPSPAILCNLLYLPAHNNLTPIFFFFRVVSLLTTKHLFCATVPSGLTFGEEGVVVGLCSVAEVGE